MCAIAYASSECDKSLAHRTLDLRLVAGQKSGQAVAWLAPPVPTLMYGVMLLKFTSVILCYMSTNIRVMLSTCVLYCVTQAHQTEMNVDSERVHDSNL